jgi:hypothetical protein
MQKVEGSSPFIRSLPKPRPVRGFVVRVPPAVAMRATVP